LRLQLGDMRKLAKTHQRPILSHPEASDISGCPSQQRRREVTCACSSSCVIGRVQLKLQLAIEEHTIRRAAYLFNLNSGGGRSHISESNHGANPATRVAPLKIRGESYVQQSQDYRDHGAIVAAPVCNHLNCGTCGALIRGGGSGATFWAFALPLGSVI